MQIGDNDEVMYLGAKSNEERKEWMQAFRTGMLVMPSHRTYSL